MKRSWPVAALSGVATGAVILGAAAVLAGLLERAGLAGGEPFPAVAVGSAFVDHTPAALREWAIATFDGQDKTALFVGMGVVLVCVCALLGVLAARRRQAALLGFAVLGALGAAAVLTRPRAVALDVGPTVVGTLVGLFVLGALLGPPAPAGGAARAAAPARHEQLARRPVLGWGVGLVLLGLIGTWAGRGLASGSQQVRRARERLQLPAVRHRVRVPAAAQVHVPGETPFIVPAAQFYRVDTALVVPEVDPATWQLHVHGLVEREVTLTWQELLARPMQEAMVTLTCVSNEVGGDLAGNAVWTGWPVRDLLAMARPHPDADMVLSRSVDGFTAGTPLSALTDGRNALVAIGMNGKPLPFAHGFPARLVVPGLYGYVSATKWVTDLKVTTFARDEAYWTTRGWSVRGPVKTASRIDVPQAGTALKAGPVAVAGVAWAQHRGIDKVEVRVDDGPWRRARLAAEPTIDAWREWVLRWDAPRGHHTLTVRATDGEGHLQTKLSAPPVPDGASGWHTISVRVD